MRLRFCPEFHEIVEPFLEVLFAGIPFCSVAPPAYILFIFQFLSSTRRPRYYVVTFLPVFGSAVWAWWEFRFCVVVVDALQDFIVCHLLAHADTISREHPPFGGVSEAEARPKCRAVGERPYPCIVSFAGGFPRRFTQSGNCWFQLMCFWSRTIAVMTARCIS